ALVSDRVIVPTTSSSQHQLRKNVMFLPRKYQNPYCAGDLAANFRLRLRFSSFNGMSQAVVPSRKP
ncbi:hypothetical protein AAIH70_23020, partial [Neorhizobium sp. BT27B]|uniref:hypothetical protein n=1 Tax=Neorhizobium sp. BT27B TaxID=3142625 RepID=UPI003D2B9D06